MNVPTGERYDKSADVYSLAITMYEVADRELPFTRSERASAVLLGVKVATEVSAYGMHTEVPVSLVHGAILCVLANHVGSII